MKSHKNYDGRQVPRRSPRSRGMDALIWRQDLGCNVLISTSVLDNGISLHADAVDHLVLCNLLGNLYDMEVRAKAQGTENSNFYLRHQLSWLGKEYDPTRWIDYQETADELTAYLEPLAQSGKRLSKEE